MCFLSPGRDWYSFGALALNAISRIREFTFFLPFVLITAGLCQTTHTVTVGSNACNGGLSFVDSVGICSNQSTVNVGDTINWVWGDSAMPHSTTSGTCVGAVCQTTPFWDSGEFVTGGGHTFSRVLNNPGVFPYFCTVHDSSMVGTVRVLPASAAFISPHPPIAVGLHPWTVVTADFNNDGKLDLVVANRDSNSVTILLGNGNGTFTAAAGSPIAGFNGPNSIAVADFNNDGKLDLAVSNGSDSLGSASVTILLGNGNGTFGLGSSLAAGKFPQGVIAADFDGDGKMDLALTITPLVMPFTSGNLTILLGNGIGGFAAPVVLSTNALSPTSLAAFDFNKDNKPDLAVANSGGGSSGNQISIFLNTSSPGNVTFSGPTNFNVGVTPHGIVAGIFNNSQGTPTAGIAVPNSGANTVGVYLADSGGNFTPASGSPFVVGNTGSPSPFAVAAGDFNGDGYLDLAVVNYNESTLSSLMNDAAGSFNSIATIASGAASSPRDIAVGDFNGDGKPDLALANFSTNDISILINSTSFPPATAGPATHFGISVQSAGPLTPEGNPSTTAGVSFQITVTAYDAYQKITTGYRGTVHFHSSDGQSVPSAGLPADYTFTGTDNGVHMFAVTLKTAEPAPAFQTIDLHDMGDATIDGRSSDILVHPGIAASFTVVAPANATAGTPFNFSVTAKDAYGNRATGYAGMVQFSSSDAGGCVALPSPSSLTNGLLRAARLSPPPTASAAPLRERVVRSTSWREPSISSLAPHLPMRLWANPSALP